MKFFKLNIGIIGLVFASLLPLVSLIHTGVPMGHDWPDHVARIANFYASFAEGNMIPRWAANLNWGYGHPILMFLYPFSSYLASLFHTVGFNFVDSTKLVFAVTYTGSILAMYVWLAAAFGKRTAIIGALLYGFAPYRFVDLHVRGALGEHAAFMFPPLVCYFMQELQEKRKNTLAGFIGVSLSVGLLILSHNAIAILFMPVFGLYALYLISRSDHKLRNAILLAAGVAVGFALSAFFWIPAYFEGKYTLRDIVTAGEALQRFVPWQMFVYSPWNYGGGDQLTKFLGIVQWSGIVAALFAVFTDRKSQNRTVLCALLILFGLSLIMMTHASLPIWKTVTLLQKFQFPWRIMSVTTFVSSILGGIGLGRILTKQISVIACCVLIVISTAGMWYPKGYKDTHESHFTGIYLSTTDTGESSPVWSVRFMEHTPPSHAQVVSGDAVIREGLRTSTVHEYVIDTKSPSRIVEHTLFFPGWKIIVDGVPTGIQFQDPDYRGLMTYRLTEGRHLVRVQFTDTKLRKISTIVSVVSVATLFISSCIYYLWKRKK